MARTIFLIALIAASVANASVWGASDEPAPHPLDNVPFLDEPLDEPVDKFLDEPLDEPADESLDELLDEPMDESLDELLDEPVDESLDEPLPVDSEPVPSSCHKELRALRNQLERTGDVDTSAWTRKLRGGNTKTAKRKDGKLAIVRTVDFLMDKGMPFTKITAQAPSCAGLITEDRHTCRKFLKEQFGQRFNKDNFDDKQARRDVMKNAKVELAGAMQGGPCISWRAKVIDRAMAREALGLLGMGGRRKWVQKKMRKRVQKKMKEQMENYGKQMFQQRRNPGNGRNKSHRMIKRGNGVGAKNSGCLWC